MIDTQRLNMMDAGRTISASGNIGVPFNTDVLDLQGLCDRCMGNLDLVQRVLARFDQRLPEELAMLERAMELGDAANVALIAHRIRGSSSNVSATALQQAAGAIEDLGRAGQLDDIHGRLRNLREQWQRYVDCRPALRPTAVASATQRATSSAPIAPPSEAHS